LQVPAASAGNLFLLNSHLFYAPFQT